MKRVVTLTLNPAIDVFSTAEAIAPTRKTRTSDERLQPGGGGINVARVVRELGGDALAVYLSGGPTGKVLDSLVEDAQLRCRRVAVEGRARVSFAVREQASGLEYRFVPEGPMVSDRELRHCLDELEKLDCDYLVASGSLPPGAPSTFYREVARLAARKAALFVLDTHGDALRDTLGHGVYLVKPSLGELETYVGRPLRDPAAQEEAVAKLIRSRAAGVVALTLGRDGALLSAGGRVFRARACNVPVRSSVGAGDSFLAGMVFGLAEGRTLEDAFRFGVAAGSAAVMRAGTAACRLADVVDLYSQAPAIAEVQGLRVAAPA